MESSTTSENTQYLTFSLDSDAFAVDIAQIREVLEYTKITKVPQTPEYMPGVINLRGSVVPVIDLRLKFQMSKTEMTVDTCIIIVDVEIDGERKLLGALADAVQEVMDMSEDQIDPPPKLGTQLNTNYIKGMGKYNDQFIIILDIEKVFSNQELSSLQDVKQSIPPLEEHVSTIPT
ncbi:MAG: purine-binding chemotaxis protein CheW [bacterium]|jgi:purine-binding chemotaxis protein CheW